MKHLRILAAVLTSLLIFAAPAAGLSIAEPCYDDSIDCQVKKCHVDNYVKDWDEQAGGLSAPRKDCDSLERRLKRHKTAYLVFAVLAPLAAGSLTVYYLKVLKPQQTAKK